MEKAGKEGKLKEGSKEQRKVKKSVLIYHPFVLN
jgi:hypothetical protein